MKTYKELSIAEAVSLSLNATPSNPVRFAFKDRSESCGWTEAKLLGVVLRSEYPFSSSLGCRTELCAQINEKLDPVASGHNPKGLKESEVGVSEGWRLLTKEEHEPKRRVFDTSFCGSFSDGWSSVNDWMTLDGTLRTKKPAGFYLPKPDVFKPWTLETAPKGLVLVRSLSRPKSGADSALLVVEWRYNTVIAGASYAINYESLQHGYEHSLDGGKTWSPCGLKEAAE